MNWIFFMNKNKLNKINIYKMKRGENLGKYFKNNFDRIIFWYIWNYTWRNNRSKIKKNVK